MSDNESNKNDDDTSKIRKRVKVVEEIVEDDPSESDSTDGDGEAKSRYTTEHKAGSKVRVARSNEPYPAQTSDDAHGTSGQAKSQQDKSHQDKSKQDQTKANQDETKANQDETKANQDQTEQASASQDKPTPGRRAVSFANDADAADPADDADQPDQPASDQDAAGGGQPDPMAEFKVDEPDVTTSDFEAMLAGGGASAEPKSADVSAGDRITGRIVAIGETYLFVEFGSSKSEGVAKREDFEPEDGPLQVAEGDEVEFYVLSTKHDEIQLGKKLAGRQGALEAIRTAAQTGVPIDGRVTGTNKGGFEVAIGGVQAFCPISQIELGYTDDPEVHVDESYEFRVQKVTDRGRNVVVSRAALLEEERAAQREQTLETLEEGKVVAGKVTRVVDFGAFVDIGGVEGLVHISELAHGFFDDASEVVSSGDEVKVKILNFGEDDRGRLKIGLSIKETQGNPWDEVNKKFSVGQQVEGEVIRLAPFGAFVEISEGIDGLVHVSEMSWKEHVKHPRDVVSAGDRIMVEVQDIDQARQRVSLSMKAVEGDPWDSAAERYTTGMEVSGNVENIEDFGAFVRLDTGITALIPRSEMELPSGVTPHRKYEVGTEATARVLNVDADDRKMALTEKDASDIDVSSDAGSSGSKSKSKSTHTSSSTHRYEDDSGGFGTLGDLLGDD